MLGDRNNQFTKVKVSSAINNPEQADPKNQQGWLSKEA